MNPALLQQLTLTGLIAIMLAMGLKVTFAEETASIRQRCLVFLSLLANFVLVQAAAIGLLYLFNADAMVWVGFLILAVCPGASAGPPLAALARGDVPCAVGQMVILSVASAVLSPALLTMLLVRLLPESDLRVDYLAVVRTLLVAQVLPLAVGLAFHHGASRLTARTVRPFGLLANLGLLGVLVLVGIEQYDTLAQIELRGWIGMFLLLAASLGIGWLCGGTAQETRKTLALTPAVRNAAVGLVIVSATFAGTAAVTAVVAYALVSTCAALACAVLFAAMPVPAAVPGASTS